MQKCRINCGSGYRTHSGYSDTQVIFISKMHIHVTDGMFCMNGTTSVPKSVLRYMAPIWPYTATIQLYIRPPYGLLQPLYLGVGMAPRAV